MRIVVLYRPRSEHEGRVRDFAAEYKHIKRSDLELMNLDSREGDEVAKLYGVTQYPAVLAIAGDGSLQKLWQGDMLPLMNELGYYDQPVSNYRLKPHGPGLSSPIK